MRSTILYYPLISFLICLSACQPAKDKPEFLFRASLLVTEDHSWFKAFDYFSQILAERSQGRIKLEVYPTEQLAKEAEAIRLIRSGVIDMTISAATLTNWAEILTFSDMPFLLRDSTDMKKLINSPVGQQIEQAMKEKIGLRPLGYFQRGPRHLTSNRPIRHPDDLKGLIVRVPNAPSYVTAWTALGAKPTPMAFSEVFTSLQQGTIEAQENPFAMIKNAGFAEVQNYLNLTAHVVSWGYPLMGEKQFASMPEDLQKILLEAAADMQRYEHHIFLESQKKVQAELQSAGMEFIEVNKEAFIQKCEAEIYASLSPEMQKVYKQIKEIIK